MSEAEITQYGEATARNEQQERRAVHQERNASAITAMESESLPYHWPDDTRQTETMSAVLYCPLFITYLFKYRAE